MFVGGGEGSRQKRARARTGAVHILSSYSHTQADELPRLYWNAAGGMYAYVVGRLAELGLAEAAHHSQLVGYAPMRSWGLHSQQYPSTSLLDWQTGEGTAKCTRAVACTHVACARIATFRRPYAPQLHAMLLAAATASQHVSHTHSPSIDIQSLRQIG